jgi:hypothetical protein
MRRPFFICPVACSVVQAAWQYWPRSAALTRFEIDIGELLTVAVADAKASVLLLDRPRRRERRLRW